MRINVKDIRKELKDFIKNNVYLFFTLTVTTVLSYSILIVNALTNSVDGIWHGVLTEDIIWQIPIGRWFWWVLDKVNFNVYPSIITDIKAIMLFVLAFIIIARIFAPTENNFTLWIVLSLGLISVSLSSKLAFRYASTAFAIAFLFAVLSFAIMVRYESKYADYISILLLIFSLATYQNEIGVFCSLSLLYGLKKIGENKGYFLRLLRILLYSIVFYICSIFIILKLTSMQLLNYRIDTFFSIDLIIDRLNKAFLTIPYYFVSKAIGSEPLYTNALGIVGVILNICVWLAIFIVLFYRLYKLNKNKKNLFTYIFVFVLAFVSVNIVPVVTDTYISPHMSLNIMCFYIVLILYLFTNLKKYMINSLKTVYIILFLILLGQFYMIQYDQLAMLDGKEYIKGLIYDIEETLYDTGYNGEDIVILGTPTDVDFDKKFYYDKANMYAKYGFIGERECWLGWFNNIANKTINLANEETWNKIEQQELRIQNNKTIYYPNIDGIEYKDNIVIIRLSKVTDWKYKN